MVLWASQGFAEATGLDLAACASRLAGVGHDHLFHTMLGLLDVNTALYESATGFHGGVPAQRGGGAAMNSLPQRGDAPIVAPGRHVSASGSRPPARWTSRWHCWACSCCWRGSRQGSTLVLSRAYGTPSGFPMARRLDPT